MHARARDRARDGARAAPFCRFSLISHRNCGKQATPKNGKRDFVATPASDRFDRERAARGIDFDAVGKARLIENMAKIDPHSLRERDSTLLMKRRKVAFYVVKNPLTTKFDRQLDRWNYRFERTKNIMLLADEPGARRSD